MENAEKAAEDLVNERIRTHPLMDSKVPMHVSRDFLENIVSMLEMDLEGLKSDAEEDD